MNILVVDDEELIRNVVKEYLLNEGYKVYEASNGLEAINAANDFPIDLIIMDIMMPKMDGLTACEKIRSTKEIPFIILSARTDEYDKLSGFKLGIDDYVTKPFSPKLLMARVNAVLRRYHCLNSIIEIKGIRINDLSHEVYVDNKEVFLTPKEYELLKYFILNKNIALSREKLLTNIWGYDYCGEDRTIDTHIKTLRNRLGKYRYLIKTIREVGYKFEYKEKI